MVVKKLLYKNQLYEVIIDACIEDTYDSYIWRIRNHADKYKYVVGYKKGETYLQEVRLHRLVLDYYGDMMVDHINHNGLDNRKDNLRICTRSQNGMNSIKKQGFSKYKGVSFRKNRSFYVVRIQVNGIRKSLGCFKSEIEAAKAYNLAAIKEFGKFALLNEIAI